MTEATLHSEFQVDAAAYLKDLQQLVTRTEDDLRARSEELSEVDSQLRAEYHEAREKERTLDPFESWRDEYLTQVAVGWVLSSVFLRYLEDNALIAELWLAGPGDRLKRARDRRQHYFQQNPTHTDREYLQEAFRTLARLPGCEELFAEGRNPLWLLGPSGDLSKEMVNFWQEIDPETGDLVRVFGDPEAETIADTRFLGDLYQDLSEAARKRFALLQTPDFVEEFILDKTLEPAVETFGLEEVRMLDPTCGSGHFLLGGFARLLEKRHREKPGEQPRVRVQKALDGVYGVDLNPFAAAIARFRLLVAALNAAGTRRLQDAPDFKVHVAAGDSLLHGREFDREGQRLLSTDRDWMPDAFATGDFEEANKILSQQYHAVVGNPPYIIDRDRAHNAKVRDFYSTCYQKFSLAVPFKELFFNKASGLTDAGYIGMITANSFMKREFGKVLIEEFFPTVELSHVIDTSGAYIPGHGTPTVILLGRARSPKGTSIKAALGIRGEPSTPNDPAQGKVWKSIVDNIDKNEAENDFITVTSIEPSKFYGHPWSLAGGGASELKELIETAAQNRIEDIYEEIGWTTVAGEDDIWIHTAESATRAGVAEATRPLVVGDRIRDWALGDLPVILYPYERLGGDPLPSDHFVVTNYLWPFRTNLRVRTMFKKTLEERGLPFYEHMQHSIRKFKTPLSITFAFVATHNHFVLDRGGKVFNRSAPVIKLPEDATEDDHLALLGLLNSSVACFWLKQVSHDKGATSDKGVLQGDPEKFRFEFDGTKMASFPLPRRDGEYRGILLQLTRALDEAGRALSAFSFQRFVDETLDQKTNLRAALSQKCMERNQLRLRMYRWQEELDWLCYEIYGVIDSDCSGRSLIWTQGPDQMPSLEKEMRPYRHKQDPDAAELDELARKRLNLIARSRELKLLEAPEHKRRWFRSAGAYDASNLDDSKILAEELERWLLDKIEIQFSSQEDPALTTTARIADQLARNDDFLQVAKLHTGRDDFDLSKLVAELATKEDVPYLAPLRFKPKGLRKRAQWEKTWDLQRREDGGEKVGKIPVPPKYNSSDFLKSHYWSLRGKLDVPKERFISYPLAERSADPSPVIGWAGWNQLEQANALASYYRDRKEQDGWDTERLTPLLAGLHELIPWLKQWHNDIDPDFGDRLGDFYETYLDQELRSHGLTTRDLESWRPPSKSKKR